MMTRREKLLVRPWQLRRYNNHRKKVLNAIPQVDFSPPPQRRHVTIKLKKLQKEKERQTKIENDNFKLLQNLGSIMNRKRVDNYWKVEPPTFLRKVAIYHRTRSPSLCEETSAILTPEIFTTRKLKCLACHPRHQKQVTIPDVRMPWQPAKKILTRRQSESAVVPIKSDFDFSKVQNHPKMFNANSKLKSGIKIQKLLKKNEDTNKKIISGKHLELPSISSSKKLSKTDPEEKIVLRQGSLQITFNLSSFAEIKLVQGKKEKFLQRNLCECKGFPSIKPNN